MTIVFVGDAPITIPIGAYILFVGGVGAAHGYQNTQIGDDPGTAYNGGLSVGASNGALSGVPQPVIRAIRVP